VSELSKVKSLRLKAETLNQCRATVLMFAVAFVDGDADLSRLVDAVRRYKLAVMEYEKVRGITE